MTALWGSGNTFEPLFCLKSWLIPIPTPVLREKKKKKPPCEYLTLTSSTCSLCSSELLSYVYLLMSRLHLQFIYHTVGTVHTPLQIFLCSLSLYSLFFYWRMIALQNFVVFYQTSTWINHRYTYISYLWKPSHLLLHLTPLDWHRALVWVSWAIQQIPHWFSILHMVT